MDMDSAKKALPKIAIAIGAALIVIVLIRWMMTPRTTTTVTTKGAIVIPSYDYYQDNYAAPSAAPQMPANYTTTGAIPPAPVCADGSNCHYETDVCGDGQRRGCKESDAANYDPNTSCPCIGCCTPKLYGCLDKNNTNFNPWANTNDDRFCAKTTACTPGPLTGVLGPAGDLPGIPQTFFVTSVYGAQVGAAAAGVATSSALPAPMEMNGGCIANFADPLLGGLVSCGNDWSLSNGQYALGPTIY